MQSIVVMVWIAINVAAGAAGIWDKYPFILLNLVFSTQAAYAAPLILLAQNREADRDRADTERDRELNARSLADTEFLTRGWPRSGSRSRARPTARISEQRSRS